MKYSTVVKIAQSFLRIRIQSEYLIDSVDTSPNLVNSAEFESKYSVEYHMPLNHAFVIHDLDESENENSLPA